MREAILGFFRVVSRSSWATSTLSQMAMASVGFYLLGASWIALKTGDISALKWAAEVFGASYLTARTRNGSPSKEPEKLPEVKP